MSTIIMLDGGAGRIVSAIPSLIKYHKSHPNEEWYIMVWGWDCMMWGIPELQERTFNVDTNGAFDIFWSANKVLTPEPYRVPEYYRNEISLVEAFDVVINDSYDHSDLPPMQFNLSISEKRRGFDIIEEAKEKFQKKKTVVIQPYGSTAFSHKTGMHDDSLRSIPTTMLDYFIDNLTKKYNVIYMGFEQFHDQKTFRPNPDPSLREWAAIIQAADYFIGCDSCGQHICKALNKPASVVIAGTHRVNVTYNDFHIIERDISFSPDAMRISNFRAQMSSRLNEQRIYFTKEEIKQAYSEIVSNLEKV